MKIKRLLTLAAIALLVVTACAPTPAPTAAVTKKAPTVVSTPKPAATVAPTQVPNPTVVPATPAAITSTQPAGTVYAPVIDPAKFVTRIDNPYFPLQPGRTFVYEGKTEVGNEHDEVYVSRDTKVIVGVTCVVVTDTVTVDGKLEELTIDWYAQDKQGNVWYFGEDAKAYDKDNVISTHGSWEAGVNGAKPGIVMPVNPQPGDPYRQEYYKGEAEDMAQVLRVTGSISVPYGSYTNVLITKEWSAIEPQLVIENKYYARGVGFILSKVIEGGSGDLRLVAIRND